MQSARSEGDASGAPHAHDLLAGLGDPYVVFSPVLADAELVEFRIDSVSTAARREHGPTLAGREGRRLTDLVPGVRGQQLLDGYRRAFETGEPFEIELALPRLLESGERTSMEVEIRAVRAGRQLLVVWRDVGARRAESAHVRRSEERLRLALAAGGLGIWEWDVVSGDVYWSPETYAVMGIGPAELGGRIEDLRRLVHPSDREALWECLDRALATPGQTYEHTFRVIRPDGVVRWLHHRGEVVREGGRPHRMLGVVSDVTERRLAEDARRASEQRLRTFLDSGVIGIVECDVHGRIHRVNDEILRMLGRSRDELEGGRVGWRDLTPLEWAEVDRRALAETVQRGQCKPFEKQLLRKDGSRVWVLIGFTLTDVARGEGIAFVLDLSERKRVERELRDRVEELTTIMDVLPVPVMVGDATCATITGNRAAHALFGVPLGNNISRTPPQGQPPGPFRVFDGAREIAGHDLPMQRAVRTGTAVLGEHYQLRFDDGRIVHLACHAAPLFSIEGTVRGCLGVFVDVTEHRRMEHELREVDRRKDAFLSQLAHELRNPLATVGYGLGLFRQSPEDSARALPAMERQLAQIVRLVDDLLDVSRIRTGKIRLRVEPTELVQLVTAVIEASQPAVDAAGHTLALQASEPVWVLCDPTRLAQVATNLIANAVRYTPPGGAIRVTVAREGGHALLRVADDGIGIAPEMLERIFELFVQGDGEPTGAGLGVGLSLVRTLVELHGGVVRAESAGLGRGSELIVRLPLREAPAEVSAPVARASNGGVARLSALVVDDNADAAEMLALVLERLGHEARVVYDGRAALQALEASPPDVVLLDLGLPEVDGHTVARAARARYGASIAIAALSGWGRDEDRERSRNAGCDIHLVKPVELDALTAFVEAVASRR
jgi:two-component system CheB/CheR fusion protein